MAKLKCGLIQMGFKGDVSMEPDQIRDIMLEAHAPFIDEAGKQGVQVLCFQEVCGKNSRRAYHEANAGIREEIQHGHRRSYL